VSESQRELARPRRLMCLRGIDVVRNKIKSFAQRKVTLADGRHKIIILDEADSYVPPRPGKRALTGPA
jgi:hypothetical protein